MAKNKPRAGTPTTHHVAAAEPVAASGGEPASLQSKLDHADAAFAALQTELAAIDAGALVPLKGDLQRAAVAALGVALWAQTADARARFAGAAACEALRFSASSVARLERASLAAWYVRHHALLSADTTSEAKLSPALDAASLEVRNRMFKCAEYNLDDNPEAVKVIDHVRPGTGYLDRANDLYALAGLYRKHAAALSRDPRNWRDDDERSARKRYVEILQELGLVPGADGVDWIEMGARAWHELRAAYAEVESVGRCLYRNENPDRLFPNLVASSRDARSPAKADAKAGEKPAESVG